METVGDLIQRLKDEAAQFEDMGAAELACGILASVRIIDDNLSSDCSINGAGCDSGAQEELEAATAALNKARARNRFLTGKLAKYECNLQEGIPAISDFYAKKMGLRELNNQRMAYEKSFHYSHLGDKPGKCEMCRGTGTFKGVVSSAPCKVCGTTGVDLESSEAIPALLDEIGRLRALVLKQNAMVFLHGYTEEEMAVMKFDADAQSVADFYSSCRSNYRGD